MSKAVLIEHDRRVRSVTTASAARYPLCMTLLRPRVDELLPVSAVAPRPPFVHIPA
jgi:hypothetical protein